MTALVFVDTNVLIYSRDSSEPVKARVAAEWLDRLDGANSFVCSPQVLNEAFAVSTVKFKRVPRSELQAWIRDLLPHCMAPLDASVTLMALDLEDDFALAWWDCLIVASALAAGCSYLLSEDMQHMQTVRTVRIVNPFKIAPSELLS